jgi:hypothetical protein
MRMRSSPARRQALAVLLCFTTAGSCQSVPDASSTAVVTPLAEAVPTGPSIDFPPATDRRDRRALPRTLRTVGTDAEIAVTSPELDDDGKFEFAGQTLRVSFNAKLKFDLTAATPPLRIEPAVPGKLKSVDGHAIEFVADAPFDPDATYTAMLSGITDEAGKPVLGGWKGAFRADPQVWIGGKMLSYLPNPGEPRIVMMSPGLGTELGGKPSFDLLFDQPVEPAVATTLVEITRETASGDRKVGLRARRAAKGVFDGIKIDRKHLVTVTTRENLAPGTTIKVLRKDTDVSEHEAEQEFHVAEELTHTGVECWSSDCSFTKGTLHLGSSSFVIKYSNAIAVSSKDAKGLLSIEPSVPNLNVYNDTWSSTGRLNVSGGFAPSTTYAVTVAAVKDKFGQGAPPVEFTIETPPLTASVTMAEGGKALTVAKARKFTIDSRNVKKATLRLWKIGDDVAAWDAAQTKLSSREPPTEAPAHVIEIEPKAVLNTDVKTTVDLAAKLGVGRPWLVSLVLDEAAFSAKTSAYPAWSPASRPPMAMLTVYDDTSMAVHGQAMADAVLVHVASVTTGEPVAGATFKADGHDLSGITTDAEGVALLPLDRAASDKTLLHVEQGGNHTQVRLGRDGRDVAQLAPQLAGISAPPGDVRAMVITDRGVYRPGSKVFIKGIARTRAGNDLPAKAGVPVRMRVVSPTGDEAFTSAGTTNANGSFSVEYASEKHAEIGRYTIAFETTEGSGETWAESTVQIAEFEPPRFTVDVEATGDTKRVSADVKGRYLFGADMGGANVTWTLTRRDAALPKGDMVGRGLAFAVADSGGGSYYDYDYDDEGEDGGEYDSERWTRMGEGKLDASGKLSVAQPVEMPTEPGPQRFVFEATVQDESHRTITARDDVTVFDAKRYAGVRITDRSLDLKSAEVTVPLELGVADREGNAVAGADIEAVLERVEWKRTRKPTSGTSYADQWHEVRNEVARCKVKSTRTVVECPLPVKKSGDYVVTAYVDGKKGGSGSLWAYSYGDGARQQRPGNALEIGADRRDYAPGDTAKIEVVSPFAEAIAIVTLEGGSKRVTQSKRVTGASATFDVVLEPDHAPWAHVTATVLPIDKDPETALQWKFGAMRLPVALGDARVELAVTSDRPVYAPGDKATLDIAVTKGGSGVAGAEIALAVVDEGVLRLTDFHAPDPVAALRPGVGLSVHVTDNRDLFAALGIESHIAGDGGSEGDSSLVSTRKNFVQTALWKPDLVSGDDGHIKVELPLPDNLTRFRMMAVVLDSKGRGAVHESAFEVRKPLMVVPAVPRFAIVGDSFEVAAVVHNGTDAPMHATVTLGDDSREVDLAPSGHTRVAFAFSASAVGTETLTFDATAADGARDRVEALVPIQAPGLEERPRLAGQFTGAQDIRVALPDDVFTDPDAGDLLVTMGVALWPELGERVEYLVDYPHGCVEQTTSSTLPLLAARELLPRLGFLRYTKAQLDERILAGVERLATMRTDSGGLAYWPGDGDANPYGTAYAMRAIIRAEQAGVAVPAGLRDGMVTYLEGQLESSSQYPGDLEVRAAIALALAEAESLPASSADSLFESASKQGPFGQATLALALASLPGEEKRAQELVDMMLKSFDDAGKLTVKPVQGEFAYYGSNDRTIAQATLALLRLRKDAPMLPAMLDRLVTQTDSYTTQSTAFGLLALADHLRTVTAEPIDMALLLDGEVVQADMLDSLRMGTGAQRYRIPLEALRGRNARIGLRAADDRAVGFLVEATWRRPFSATGALAATSAKNGPDVYRVFNDPAGGEIDLAKVKPGQLVRVTLLARMPEDGSDDDEEDFDRDRLGYVALTDAIGAGFEPVQPDLATMATVPDLASDHPLAQMLSWGSAEASHSELHDNRVNLYFDRVWGDWVAATYLVRATTPGTFVVAPARVELMYEPDSLGYSDIAQVTVVP